MFFLSTPGTVECPLVATSCEQPYVTILWIRSAKFNEKKLSQMVSAARSIDLQQLSTSACTQLDMLKVLMNINVWM